MLEEGDNSVEVRCEPQHRCSCDGEYIDVENRADLSRGGEKGTTGIQETARETGGSYAKKDQITLLGTG